MSEEKDQGSGQSGSSNPGGDPSTQSSITKPPQFLVVVAVAAAVGGAVGAVIGSMLG